MAFDLGTLIRAAALGGGAYQQARRDEEDRTREQRREDEQERRERAREERDTAEAILRQEALRIANERNAKGPPVPPRYRATVHGVSGDYDTLEEAIAAGAKIRTNMPDPDRRTDDRLPHEIELDELRRREAELRLFGAERENRTQTAEPSDDLRINAGVLLGTTGATRPDPNNALAPDLDMRAVIERNLLIRSLIHDHGLTPAEAEREARRRLGN